MQIYLITVGKRLDSWIETGYQEYAKRLTGDCHLQLIEIPPAKRTKHADIQKILQEEGERMSQAIPKNTRVIALDLRGEQWDTPKLAQQLQKWQFDGRSVSLLIGGPEGLAPSCSAKAEQKWSLSNLTLPHPLVRIVVAEQLYRAWSILHKHPYHRD